MILNSSGRPFDDFLNRGEVLPHVLSFAAIWNNLSKIYSYRWDEALRHQPENALAMRRDCYIRALLQERAMPIFGAWPSEKPARARPRGTLNQIIATPREEDLAEDCASMPKRSRRKKCGSGWNAQLHKRRS